MFSCFYISHIFIFRITFFFFLILCLHILYRVYVAACIRIFRFLRPSPFTRLLLVRVTRVMGFDRLRYCCPSILDRRENLKKRVNTPIAIPVPLACLFIDVRREKNVRSFGGSPNNATRLRGTTCIYSSPERGGTGND